MVMISILNFSIHIYMYGKYSTVAEKGTAY